MNVVLSFISFLIILFLQLLFLLMWVKLTGLVEWNLLCYRAFIFYLFSSFSHTNCSWLKICCWGNITEMVETHLCVQKYFRLFLFVLISMLLLVRCFMYSWLWDVVSPKFRFFICLFMKCPLVSMRSVCGVLMIDENGNSTHEKEFNFLYSIRDDGQY